MRGSGSRFSAIWGFRGEVTPAVTHVLLLSGIFTVAVPASVVIILRIDIIANAIVVIVIQILRFGGCHAFSIVIVVGVYYCC